MDSLQFAILVIIHQVSQAGGAVNITFDGNGYIGQSIVLQCKTDAASIVTPSAVWYFNNNVLLSTSSGRYTEIRTSDGFNLTVSDLTTADEGYYRCRIDFGSSSNKTLGILYNTSIHITDNPSTLTVTITIIAYPAPTYDVILRENGTKINVLWNSTNITLSNGAINITQINWSTLNKADYSLTVNVTSPVAAFQLYLVKFAPTPDPVTTPPPGTTTTTTTTVTSSSTSMSSATSSVTIDNTSTNPTTRGSSASATISTSTSMSPTAAVSPANNTSNTSTSTKPTISGSTTINNTTSSGTKSIKSDIDIKVIVPAVVVPCGLLIIGGIILVVCCVRHKTGKNVRESPDGMAVQDKGNNIEGWKQSQGHGKATDNLDTMYTTPDGFLIYPGPAAMSTARSYKDKKYLDVTDQYSRPYPGMYHHQAAYIPSTYTSARAYTHKDKKHQYSRPSAGTYGYQVGYVPNTYMSARTSAPKGKNYDYEGHQQASHQVSTSRPAYDQATYYPQTGHYGHSGEDVYYSGGGQYSYGHRSRSHHDHSGRKQQREYYNQYEMADYGGNRTGYRHTKQDAAFYY